MIMTDSQATDFETFDFNVPWVCYFAIDTTGHRMNFFSVHNVAKWSKYLMQHILTECVHALRSYRINVEWT